MKGFIQPPTTTIISLLLLPLLLTTPYTSVSVFAQSQSSGYITGFTAPECVQTGAAASRIETVLYKPDKCFDVPLFTSFQAGVAQSCPTDKKPKVTAYSLEGCTGTGLDAGTIPLDHSDSPCTEFVVSLAGQGGALVSAGGRSARFECV